MERIGQTLTQHLQPRIQAIAREIAEREAAELVEGGGEVWFMARVMAQATLPHSRPPEGVNVFQRTNGYLTMSIGNPSGRYGLPYGGIPRLLLAWVTTEAVRTRQERLTLGPTLSGFMARLGMVPTGGRWGSIPRLREQMRRLFTSVITTIRSSEHGEVAKIMPVAAGYELWWHPQAAEQAGLWQSHLDLSPTFFEEAVRHPVPLDLGALRDLKRSPLALDLYCWLVHRLSYLRSPTTVPWEFLMAQFGAEYGRERDFRRAFLDRLADVTPHYPMANWQVDRRGLQLRPSPRAVRSRPGRGSS